MKTRARRAAMLLGTAFLPAQLDRPLFAQFTTWTNSTGNNLFADSRNWSPASIPRFGMELPTLTVAKRQIDLGAQVRDFSYIIEITTSADYRIFHGAFRTNLLEAFGSYGGALRLDANVQIAGGSSIEFLGFPGRFVINGVIGNGSGAGSFDIRAQGITLAGSNTYTGRTIVHDGTSMIQLAGSITKSSLVDIFDAGDLIISNAASENVNRIGDAVTVQVSQGSFQLLGGTERIGAFKIAVGAGGVLVQPNSGFSAKLRAASFQRVDGATATIDTDPASGQFVLDTPPSLSGGGSGLARLPILPYAISSGGSLITYSGAGASDDVGFRALDPSIEYQSQLSGADAAANVWLTSAASLDGDQSIGALVFGANSSVQLNGAKLTIQNGAVSVPSNGSSLERTIFSGSGVLAFPDEAVFHVQPTQPTNLQTITSSVILSVPIEATMLTKSGAGALVLAKDNSLTGTRLVQGDLVCRSPAALGNGALWLSRGGQLKLETSQQISDLYLLDDAASLDSRPCTISFGSSTALRVTGNLSAANPNADLHLAGDGVLRIDGNVSGGVFWPTTQTIIADGVWDANSEIRHGTITGSGTFHGWFEPYVIKPGDGIGRMYVDWVHTSWGYENDGMEFEIAGDDPGVTYDQLVALYNVELNRGDALTYLSLVVTAPLTLGEQFEIIHTQSSIQITGTFAGLPEGSIFQDDGYLFQISYFGYGGPGNDVVLTVVPEPGGAVALALATGLLSRPRRGGLTLSGTSPSSPAACPIPS